MSTSREGSPSLRGATALHALGGQRAPAGLDADLRLLAHLPERARGHFWDALGPSLADPLPASIEQTLDTFARTFAVPNDDLARAIKACRHLLREACSRGLDRARLEEDIVLLAGGPLSPEAAVIAPILLSRYDAARAAVRAALVDSTLQDHGASVVSVEWRVDTIRSSSRAAALDERTALLTLGYKQGAREERVTLHLSRQKLEELRLACERMLE